MEYTNALLGRELELLKEKYGLPVQESILSQEERAKIISEVKLRQKSESYVEGALKRDRSHLDKNCNEKIDSPNTFNGVMFDSSLMHLYYQRNKELLDGYRASLPESAYYFNGQPNGQHNGQSNGEHNAFSPLKLKTEIKKEVEDSSD